MVFTNFFLRLCLLHHNFDYLNIAIYILYLNTLNYYFKCKLIKLTNAILKKFSKLIWAYLMGLNLMVVTLKASMLFKKSLIFDFMDKYTHWLISKFMLIVKRARLTLGWLTKIFSEDGMISQEKNVWTEMLYNQKAVLVSDFIEIEKVKRELVSL